MKKSAAEIGIEAVVDAKINRIHTSEPGKIIEYKMSNPPVCKVIPVTRYRKRQADGSYITKDRLPIDNVPVLFPCGGQFSVTWELKPGDDVLILYSERSIAEWKKNGQGDREPRDARRHNESDAMVIPVGRPKATSAYVVTGGDIRLGSEGAWDFVALATKVSTELNKLRAWCMTHQHPQDFAPPTTPPPQQQSVAASKVKAE